MDCTTIDGLTNKLRYKAREQRHPIGALIELTHRCNLACVHCYQDHSNTCEELGTEDWIKALDELARAGVMFLTLSGGEALLRPDLEEICQAALARGFFLKLFTNGVLLDKKRMESIAGIKWVAVEISLLGADAPTHDALTRHPGSFDAVINALELLQAASIPLVIKTCITPQNYRQVEDIRSITKKYKARFVSSPIITEATINGEDNRHCRLTPSQMNDYFRSVSNALHEIDNDDQEPGGNLWQKTGYYPILNCNALRSALTIQPDGNILPCLVLPIPIGNIQNQNLLDLWYNDSRVKRLLQWGERNIPECYKCRYEALCSRCPGDALQEDGSMSIPGNHVCNTTRTRWKVACDLWKKKNI